jgi:hypothetical protein
MGPKPFVPVAGLAAPPSSRELARTFRLSGKELRAIQRYVGKGAKQGRAAHGLGQLFIVDRKPRAGRNLPPAGIKIPAKRVVKFRVSKAAKKVILRADTARAPRKGKKPVGHVRRPQTPTRPEVFLNVPYDTEYERLFLALIAGLVGLGFVPTATRQLPESAGRFARILKLIRHARFSIHDISRVEPRLGQVGLGVAVDDILEKGQLVASKHRLLALRKRVAEAIAGALPRFNMPFELGLAVAWRVSEQDRLFQGRQRLSDKDEVLLPQFRIFEAVNHRHKQTVSDLGGDDAYVHGGTPKGMLTALANAFPFKSVDPDELWHLYKRLMGFRKESLRHHRGADLFSARPFLMLVAEAAAERDRRGG